MTHESRVDHVLADMAATIRDMSPGGRMVVEALEARCRLYRAQRDTLVSPGVALMSWTRPPVDLGYETDGTIPDFAACWESMDAALAAVADWTGE